MPSIKQQANTSGLALWTPTSGAALKGYLKGLKIDNPSIYDEKIELLDCFTTDPSKSNAAGATQAAEDFYAIVASGKVRFQMTVPAGESVSLGKEDLEEVTFLGKAYVRGSVTTSDAVIIASYQLR